MYEMERFQLAFRYVEPSKLLLYACSDIIRIGKSLASGFVRENNWTRRRKWQNRLYFVKYICYNVLNMRRFVELLYWQECLLHI